MRGIFLFSLCFVSAGVAQVRYTITNLGTLGGYASAGNAISNAGQVTGDSERQDYQYTTFLYAPGRGMTEVTGIWADIPPNLQGTLPGKSAGMAINSRGQIAGWRTIPYLSWFALDYMDAFLYTPGSPVMILSLPGTPTHTEGVRNAFGINEAGQVTGQADTSADATVTHAFVYTPGVGTVDIDSSSTDSSSGRAINNSGQVTGFSGVRTFLYTPGSGMQYLQTPITGSMGFAINDASQIAGQLTVAVIPYSRALARGRRGGTINYYPVTNAFLASHAVTTNIGTLPGAGETVHSGKTSGLGVNRWGQVVGVSDTNAFIYTEETGMLELNRLIPPLSGWTLNEARAINDGGQITGVGTINGQQRAFLLTPDVPIYTGASRFVPLPPCRVADTRGAIGALGGPSLPAGSMRAFFPAGSCGIPANASAYALNVTVVPQSGSLAYITTWPTGQPQPLASTLNSFDGRFKANAAVIPAGWNGGINLFATDATDVVLDVNGYFVPATSDQGLAFYPLSPCRIADTRTMTALSAGEVRTIPVLSSPCNVPSSAQAYSLNLTAIPAATLDYLTAWPAGQARPLVSTLNAPTGTVTANAAVLAAGANGAISIYGPQQTDAVVDINGYFAPPGKPGASTFYAINPCRAMDTRNPAGLLGGPALGAGESRMLPLGLSACGLPPTATAYLVNVTAVPRGPLTYLTLWPLGTAIPLVSTLNAFDGAITSNAAIIPAGSNAAISAYAPQGTDLIVDVNGYFAP